MRKLLALVVIGLLSVISCTKFDDSAIWEELLNHRERIERLEAECNRLNANIEAIQVILEALQNNDYITDIVRIVENGVEVGYSLTFSKSGSITIYHGAKGEDGATPDIGIKKASDGQYYWTCGDEWLTDDEGNRIPATVSDPDADYVTPLFRVVEGVWYVSFDQGNSWTILEKGEEDTNQFFQEVNYDGKYLHIVLSDGTKVSIPTEELIEDMKNKTSEVRLAKQYDLVVGDHFQLFYLGVVKTFNLENEGIRVDCQVGRQMPRYFEYTPTESDAGRSYKLTITTRRFDGSVISLGETTLVVHPKLTDETTPSNVNVLIIGDSLTYQGEWPGEGLRRIYGVDMGVLPMPLGLNNACTTYGTKNNVINGFGVYHEGYSGWSWARFLQKTSSNPFYNPTTQAIDFRYHAAKHNNPGADLVAILMSWNGSGVTADFDCSEAINRNLEDAATILRQIHRDFPDAKIVCMGLQISSLKGGTGMWYGASGGLSDMYGAAFYAFDYSKALEEMVTNEEFGEYCYYIDTKGQFDTEYNMPSTEVSVNDRNSSETETIHTNGVHPTTEGYYQIGDAFYRGLHRVLPQIVKKNPEIPVDLDLSAAVDLSESGTANCYIVSESGVYKFQPTKGCSNESVGEIAATQVLWKSFGSSVIPKKEELIRVSCYKDGYVGFEVPDGFLEGNAVVAAKDSEGKILWSWHIWLTDTPASHAMYNEVGVMMDRNLGATSATPGEAASLGLLYQWGRKDPFLGSSSVYSPELAKSYSGAWQTVESNVLTGTLQYAVNHPTTFITQNKDNNDWYYTGSKTAENTRWTTSEDDKSIYDPCPEGWRVPDGGQEGVWAIASGQGEAFSATFDSYKMGFDFTGIFSSESSVWYPAVGYRYNLNGSLRDTGTNGVYWSASTNENYASCLITRNDGTVIPSQISYRSFGRAVRCVAE